MDELLKELQTLADRIKSLGEGNGPLIVCLPDTNKAFFNLQ